ncbi:hypothetical protein [Agrobacterium vitis]|uniref:hypothetical protein n=1 Tax=Agrobacterium vitis TaxID=373 RepID=UPI001571A121|nr:hypothetical protein [Agrobacterium vitis]NSZ15603.1 hypothetical protein [Agrobacterium vitis]QZO04426.1 hypothetical protein K4831_02330 [Agrobacterium vitis]UJL86568.1 hypothetical protein AVF2S5_00665 [Agrobacterium vitis]
MPVVVSPIRVSQYCNGDGINEDAGFSSFLSALTSGGRVYDGIIDVPVSLASAKTLTSYVGNLRGEGGGRLIFTGGTDGLTIGLTIDNSGLPGANNSVLTLNRLGVFTTGLSVGTGLRVKGSSANGNNLIPSVFASEITICGETPSAGWQIGFEGTQLKKSKLDAVATRGLIPEAVGGVSDMSKSALFSMYFHAGCNQVDINSPRLDWGQYGVYVGTPVSGEEQCEGIVVNGGDVRAHLFGYVADPDAGAQFQSRGVHYDTSNIGVSFGKDNAVDCDFSFITGNFFLRSSIQGYNGSYAAVLLNANYGVVSGNNMYVGGAVYAPTGRYPYSDSVGITIGSDSDASKIGACPVTSNVITAFVTAIHLRPKTKNCLVSSTRIDPAFAGGGIMNDGTNNTIVT